MGTCVNCRKRQTNNKYDYYIADAIERTAADHGNYKKVTTKFANFEKHSEFVCTRCADGILWPGRFFLVWGIVCFCLMLVFFITYGVEWNTGVSILVVIGGISELVGFFLIKSANRHISEDKRCEKGGSEQAKFSSFKTYPIKTYPYKGRFTVEEYQALT